MCSYPRCVSSARNSSRNVISPSPRTMKSTPPSGPLGLGLGSKARIIAADDARAGATRADEIDDAFGCLALEAHDREPDDIGLVLGQEPLDRFSDPVLNEHQIRRGDPMVGIELPGER